MFDCFQLLMFLFMLAQKISILPNLCNVRGGSILFHVTKSGSALQKRCPIYKKTVASAKIIVYDTFRQITFTTLRRADILAWIPAQDQGCAQCAAREVWATTAQAYCSWFMAPVSPIVPLVTALQPIKAIYQKPRRCSTPSSHARRPLVCFADSIYVRARVGKCGERRKLYSVNKSFT